MECPSDGAGCRGAQNRSCTGVAQTATQERPALDEPAVSHDGLLHRQCVLESLIRATEDADVIVAVRWSGEKQAVKIAARPLRQPELLPVAVHYLERMVGIRPILEIDVQRLATRNPYAILIIGPIRRAEAILVRDSLPWGGDSTRD